MVPSRHAATALVTCVALACVLIAPWPYTVDDAYIAATYARRLAHGLGYTFRDGPPTDGVTGPLWVLPLAIAARLGIDPLLAGKALGGASAIAAVAIPFVSLRHGARGARAAWIATLVCVTSVPLAIWSIAGLETGFATLLATVLVMAVVAEGRPRAHVAGISAALLAWLRPELAPFVASLLIGAYVRDTRRATKAIAWALTGAITVVSFRLVMFGHALPMTAAAKPAVLSHGLEYVAETALHASTALALVAIALSIPSASRRDRIVAVSLAAHVVAVVLAGGDWMPGGRLFAPVIPSFAWLLARAFTRTPLALRRASLAWTAICALAFARAVELVPTLVEAREAGADLARTAERLATLATARDTVVALDVGALAYRTGAQVVDLGGLTEPHVAYAPGGHLNKRVDSRWLQSTSPRSIVLHSRERPRVDADARLRWFAGYPVERRVLTMPWVARGYRVHQVIEHAPSYFYVVLERVNDSNSKGVSSSNDHLGDPSHPGDLRHLAGPVVLAP